MESCKFTPFGLCVKTELLRRGKTQKWLEETVSAKTGLFMDSGYTYKILTGERNAPRIIQAICEILNIPDNSAVPKTAKIASVECPHPNT